MNENGLRGDRPGGPGPASRASVHWGPMRGQLERFVIEIVIVALGTLAALLESLLVHRTDIALLIGLSSFLFAIGVVVIRQEISKQLGEALVERQVLGGIPERWRDDARAEVDEARGRYLSWAAGTRIVSEASSLNYQIDALRTATGRIRAIHLGLDRDGLIRWSDPQKGFSRLVDAYRNLPSSVRVQRILVLDEEDDAISKVVDGRRDIVDELTETVCRFQMRPRERDGIGAELRIRWIRRGEERISDLLIIDDREFCSIESLGRDRFGDLAVCVNKAMIASEVRRFDDAWTNAVEASLCLKRET